MSFQKGFYISQCTYDCTHLHTWLQHCHNFQVIQVLLIIFHQRADYWWLWLVIIVLNSVRVTCFRLVFHCFSFLRTCLQKKETKDEWVMSNIVWGPTPCAVYVHSGVFSFKIKSVSFWVYFYNKVCKKFLGTGLRTSLSFLSASMEKTTKTMDLY